jgi:hypothetical protein
MPTQAKRCRRLVDVIAMSVPTAAMYQVAYPLPPSRFGSSSLVTSSGMATTTATLNAAIQIGMRGGPKLARLSTVAPRYSTIATITGTGEAGTPSVSTPRMTW